MGVNSCQQQLPPTDEEFSLPRRLPAILAADFAGYSRLMHADEAATVRDLNADQTAILPSRDAGWPIQPYDGP